MKFEKEELREIVDCIGFVNEHLRLFNKIYIQKDNKDKYQFGYLNYLIELRNKIVEESNRRSK